MNAHNAVGSLASTIALACALWSGVARGSQNAQAPNWTAMLLEREERALTELLSDGQKLLSARTLIGKESPCCKVVGWLCSPPTSGGLDLGAHRF